jgi:hypothetical protein
VPFGFLRKLFPSPAERAGAQLAEMCRLLGLEGGRSSLDARGRGTLRGHLYGASLSLQLTDEGFCEATLEHPTLNAAFTLEYEADARKTAAVRLPLEAGSTPSGTLHLGGGLVCDEDGLRHFAGLPEAMRTALITTLSTHNVRRLRVGREQLTIQWPQDDERVSAKHALHSLQLALELCKARGLERGRAPESLAGSPVEWAKKLALELPESRCEDLSEQSFSGMWARISWRHGGAAFRLGLYRPTAETCSVWLETRAEGKLGGFGLMRWDPSDAERQASDDDDDDDDDGAGIAPEPRLFLSKDCYFESGTPRVEAARFLSLPVTAREQALAWCSSYEALVLSDEVLSLHCCSLERFLKLWQRPTGKALLLGLAEQLAAMARALPVQSAADAQLAEARTCRYCSTCYVFSPRTPECSHCGAVPEADAGATLRL